MAAVAAAVDRQADQPRRETTEPQRGELRAAQAVRPPQAVVRAAAVEISQPTPLSQQARLPVAVRAVAVTQRQQLVPALTVKSSSPTR